MKKVNKKNLLVTRKEDSLVIRQPKNEKHGEITVMVLKIALPLKNIIGVFGPECVKAIEKVAEGFQDADIKFNYNPQAPAVLFQVVGKTECRGGDTPNERIGDIVALAKANAKAANIAKRVTGAIIAVLQEQIANAQEIASYFGNFATQEINYVAEEKYLKVLEKEAKKAKKAE